MRTQRNIVEPVNEIQQQSDQRKDNQKTFGYISRNPRLKSRQQRDAIQNQKYPVHTGIASNDFLDPENVVIANDVQPGEYETGKEKECRREQDEEDCAPARESHERKRSKDRFCCGE